MSEKNRSASPVGKKPSAMLGDNLSPAKAGRRAKTAALQGFRLTARLDFR
jgi:hypothetical protein